MITFRSTLTLNNDASIVFLTKAQVSKDSAKDLAGPVKEKLLELKGSKQFSGDEGEVFPKLIKKSLILFVGVGKENELTPTKIRILVRRALLYPGLKNLKSIELKPHSGRDADIIAVIEGVLLGGYVWSKYIKPKKEMVPVSKKNITIIAAPKPIYQSAVKICAGANLARDLVNDNADTVTSTHLEKVVRGLVRGKKNASLEVLNRKELKKKGLNLHLAVNQGSNKEPKLIIVRYKGSSRKQNDIALVGKGITFDTGGLNLKPSGYMETMKMDMGGAAAVIGTLKNALDLKIKKNIVFAIGVAENAIGSGAYKPGDVITGYAGKSVEVANTDAEGRLVLADAIPYVIKNYKPVKLIDIATLTGACIVALGHDYSGLVTEDDPFSRALVRSSNETDDRIWRLPIYPELKDAVKSKIADIRNLGFPKGAAGTITAAEFLHQFAKGAKWAHLDIAGTAYVDGDQRMYFGHGATGAGVRLFTHYLMHN